MGLEPQRDAGETRDLWGGDAVLQAEERATWQAGHQGAEGHSLPAGVPGGRRGGPACPTQAQPTSGCLLPSGTAAGDHAALRT